MERTTLAAIGFAAVLVLAGCIGGGPVAAPTDGPNTTQTETPVTFEMSVFDSGGMEQSVIEGGITYQIDEHVNATYYGTLLTDSSETSRLNWKAVPEESAKFVNETAFDSASLLVVQAFPKSSVPNYRVESVTRSGDELAVRINDSSDIGTDDITLETVLIRVHHDGSPPTSAQVTTQRGVTFETGTGPETVDSERASSTEVSAVTLPLSSDNDSQNVDDPRDLTVENDGSDTVGYNFSVVATLSPDCQDAEPPCGMPDSPVEIVHETGKLQPGDSVTFDDLIARHGEYEVTVEADLPDEDGGRRTASDTFEWTVSEYYFDAVVTITDDSVEITQSAQ